MKTVAIVFAVFVLAACRDSALPPGAPDVPFLIVEYGADWCPYCVMAKPKLIELTKKLNAEFFYVDVDTLTRPQKYLAWSYIPRVAIFNHKKVYYFGGYDEKVVGGEAGDLFWTLDGLRTQQAELTPTPHRPIPQN